MGGMRKQDIAGRLVELAQEAQGLALQGDAEPVGTGQTAYTDAVARNHAETVTLKRKLAAMVRAEAYGRP